MNWNKDSQCGERTSLVVKGHTVLYNSKISYIFYIHFRVNPLNSSLANQDNIQSDTPPEKIYSQHNIKYPQLQNLTRLPKPNI